MNNSLAVSIKNAEIFKSYVQVMAIWTDSSLSDEAGWERYQAVLAYLKADCAALSHHANLTDTFSEPYNGIAKLLLSVEDARILCGKPERVDTLYQDGVRILTPLWKDNTCIGGAHNTQTGLTEFGKQALQKAVSRGMVLDISHASVKSADEMFEIAAQRRTPIIASHSNAYDICPVSRNLHREQAERILAHDGVVGLNLYPLFLRADKKASLEDLLPHLEYFLSHGFEDHLCLGCDMDGADMPQEIQNLSSLSTLAEMMLSRNYSESLIGKLFYQNAKRFASKYLK